MSVHKVKSWTYLFQAAVAGVKTHDIRDLMIAILDTCGGLMDTVFESSIKIEAYAPWAWPDSRIGWDQTYLVTVKGVGPVGYTDGPLEDIRK